MKKENSISKKIPIIIGTVALTLAGIAIIPIVLDKCSTKIYKVSLKNEEIDFDAMGPEIVPHNKAEGEE